jgi:hypothetical protein
MEESIMSLTVHNGPTGRIKQPVGAAKLPQPALRKLNRLIAAAEDAASIWRGANGRWLEAHAALTAARSAEEARVDEAEHRALRSNGPGGALVRRHSQPLSREPIDASRPPYRAATVAAEAEEARRRSAVDAADEAVDPARRIVTAIEAFLVGLADDAELEAVDPVPVKSKPDLREQLQAVRTTIEAVSTEREAVRNSPPADEDVLAVIKREVEALAERGRPRVSGILRGGIYWQQTRADIHVDGAFATASVVDALAATAWLDPDKMIAALHAEARRAVKESGRQPGPPALQRATIIATLDAQLLAAERLEAAIIDATEDAGFTVSRRPNTDPRALLGVAGPAHNA